MITVLKCKIRTAIITHADKDYNGSVTIDEDLMDAAGLVEWEKVEINAKDKKIRLKTYVLKGKRGTRCIKANGGMAQYFEVGDEVHILAFRQVGDIQDYKPLLVNNYDNDNIYMED